MIINKIQYPTCFLASTNKFLQTQFNKGRFMPCMGLGKQPVKSNASFTLQTKVFRLFTFVNIPAYFLWAFRIPLLTWVYIFVILPATAEKLIYKRQ